MQIPPYKLSTDRDAELTSMMIDHGPDCARHDWRSFPVKDTTRLQAGKTYEITIEDGYAVAREVTPEG